MAEQLGRLGTSQIQATFIAGPVIQVQESDGLISLARKARRFFPVGSAAEIWEECRPLLADTNKPDAFLVRHIAPG